MAMRERNLGKIAAKTADLVKGAELSDTEFKPFLASWAKKISSSFEDGLKAREKLEARILKTIGRVLAKVGGKKALTSTAALALIVNACAPIFERFEPTPPNPEPSPTAAQLASGTEVAPPLSQEIVRPISGVSILEQEDLLQNFPDVRDEFEKFEVETLAEFGEMLPDNVRLTAQGIITQYSDEEGDTLHPLFSIESDNPEVSTQVNLLLGLPEEDGSLSYKVMPLERGEWTDVNGRVWITLSVMDDTRGEGPLEDPAEMFAAPEDELLSNPDPETFWSPSGNALDAARSHHAKILAVLAVSTPVPEPTAVSSPTPTEVPMYEGPLEEISAYRAKHEPELDRVNGILVDMTIFVVDFKYPITLVSQSTVPGTSITEHIWGFSLNEKEKKFRTLAVSCEFAHTDPQIRVAQLGLGLGNLEIGAIYAPNFVGLEEPLSEGKRESLNGSCESVWGNLRAVTEDTRDYPELLRRFFWYGEVSDFEVDAEGVVDLRRVITTYQADRSN